MYAWTYFCRALSGVRMCAVYDDVTYVYDDVTYVYDDVTYVYDDVTYVGRCLEWECVPARIFHVMET